MWICLWEKLKIHIEWSALSRTPSSGTHHDRALELGLLLEVQVMVNWEKIAAYKTFLCPHRMWEKSALKPVLQA